MSAFIINVERSLDHDLEFVLSVLLELLVSLLNIFCLISMDVK